MRARGLVAAAVVLGIALAGILFYLGLEKAPDKASDIWFEVSTAGLQLGVIAIIGGGIAAAIKQIDAARDQRRQLDEYRVSVLRSLVASYNRIKAVRRILRAYGFRTPAATPLTADQVSVFNAQLQRLNDEQLMLEALHRELQVRQTLFANMPSIQTELRIAEKYLHDVIADWEKHGAHVQAQAPATVVGSMKQLQAFLNSSKLGFKSGAAAPLEALAEAIGSQLSVDR